MHMDIDEARLQLEFRDVLWNVVANVKATRQVLYEKKLTTPRSLESKCTRIREEIDHSPAGKQLQELKSLLGAQKSTKAN